MKSSSLIVASWILLSALPSIPAEERELRLGLIGLDTSHVIAFTQLLNDEKGADRVRGARVVAGFPGGSPDLPSSANRVGEYTKQLAEKWGVEIVNDIPTLLSRVDAVLLESVDGRPHLEQAKPVFAAKKPVYIDKPLAGSLKDAREIARLARESGTPCFSASSLRFFPGVAKLKGDSDVGEILGCDAYSPSPFEEHHPDFYWYGIHGVEILFTLMGPGCESVTRVATSDCDVVVGRWKDGRIGTFRGIRKGAAPYGAVVFGSKGMKVSDPVGGNLYKALVEEIVKFFQTGKAPVSLDETVEMFAFMSAADESKRRGGQPVALKELSDAGLHPSEPAKGDSGAGKVSEPAEGAKAVLESRPGLKGERVDIEAGEIPTLEFARFLADYTGLPVLHDAGDKALLGSISIAAPVRNAGDDLVKEILAVNQIRVTEKRVDGEVMALLIESTGASAAGEEPVARPIWSASLELPRGPAASGTREVRIAEGPEALPGHYHGLVLVRVPEVVSAQVDLPHGRGVLLEDIEAERLEGRHELKVLKKFDIVTHVGDTVVASPRDVMAALEAATPGEAVEFRLLRKGVHKIIRARRGQ